MKNTIIGIIGAGPAGIASAIQLKRYGFEPVVFEKYQIGGLLHNANLVESYLGFSDGISGKKLIDIIKNQAKLFSLDIRYQTVLKLDYSGSDFIITTSQNEYKFDYVIIASGTKPNEFDSSILNSNYNGKALYEIESILDIQNQVIAIIGAGDAAFDYAINISKRNRVMLFNRGPEVKCLPLLNERIDSNSNVNYFENLNLIEISQLANSKLSLLFSSPDEFVKHEVDYLILATGREPEISFISDRVIHNLDNLLSDGLLYFAGDVKNDQYRQTSIATGDGVKAAMMICNKIKGNI